ncbi:MAG: MBL fold metallo-hydrolase [Candidatus Hadarchaeales archaeon]
MKITVFGGTWEIGGNQILLEGRESKVFLDFGKNFAREGRYFEDPYLTARKPQQLHELGLLPRVPGLYRWEEGRVGNDRGEPEISGVLLSHAHLDHMDYVRYLREEIPIWAGDGTWRVILAREITSKKSAEERLAKFEDGAAALYDCVCVLRPNLKNFRTGRKVQVGEFEVNPVHVDHSMLASYGFILHGPEGGVAYTGDIRFHGPKKEFSEEFLKKAEGCEVLITEGTNVLESRPSSEGEVREKAEKVVEKARGLVAASFSSMDIDRMRTFSQVARDNGRKLVLSMRQAALLEFVRPEVEAELVDLPFKLGDLGVKIYRRRKESTSDWEQKLKTYETVDSSWVSEHQEEVLLFATYYDMLELLSIKPKPGSIFIYSESEPWDEEGEIEFEKLANWLEFLGMPMFHIHASGHASSLELAEMVERLSPKKVVVVHCERPALFKKFLGKTSTEVICPERGKPILL